MHPEAMLAPQRHAIITREVTKLGSVRVRELATMLSVSEMTIRRDLDILAQRGTLEKVHGGAARLESRSSLEPDFATKAMLQRNEKASIATEAARLVRPGDAIAITGGSTTWMLGQHLRSVPDLTIVTNSLSLADSLHGRTASAVNVVLTGGSRTRSDALVGPAAVNTLRSIFVDIVFMGVHGMAETGYTTPNLAEAETNRAFIDASERCVVVADHTKWGIRGLGTIARLGEADDIISDAHLAEDAVEIIRGAGTGLTLVGNADDESLEQSA